MTDKRKKYIKWIVAAPAVVVVMLALAQLPPLQRALFNIAERQLSQTTGLNTTIVNPGGFLPWSFQAESVIFESSEGARFSIDDPQIEWSPLALLTGKFVIENASAKGLQIARLSRPKPRSNNNFQIPDVGHLPKMAIRNLSIANISIETSPGALPKNYSLVGGINLLQGEFAIALDVASIGNGAEEVSVHFRHDADRDQLALEAKVFIEKDGLLSDLIEGGDAASITISGDGRASDWHGTASLKMDDQIGSNISIDCLCSSEWHAMIRGDLQGSLLQNIKFSELPHSNSKFEIELQSGYGRGQVELNKFSFQHDGLNATASGTVTTYPNRNRWVSLDLKGDVSTSLDTERADFLPLSWNGTFAVNTNLDLSVDNFRLDHKGGSLKISEGHVSQFSVFSAQFAGEIDTGQFQTTAQANDAFGAITYQGDFSLHLNEMMRIENLKVAAMDEDYAIDAILEYRTFDDVVTFNATSRVRSPVMFGGASTTLDGPVELEGQILDFTNTGNISIEINAPSINWRDMAIPSTHVELRANDLRNPENLVATLKSKEATRSFSRIEGKLAFDQSSSRNCLANLSLVLKGPVIFGTNKTCLRETGFQQYRLESETRGAGWTDNKVDGAAIEAAISQSDNVFKFDADLKAQGVDVAGILFPAITTEFSGSLDEENTLVQIRQLALTSISQTYTLRDEFDIVVRPEVITSKGFSLSGNDGGLLAVSEFEFGENIQVKASARQFAPPVLPVRIDGNVSLDISDETKMAAMDLTLHPHETYASPSMVSVNSTWRDGRIFGSARLLADLDASRKVDQQFAEWRIPFTLQNQEGDWQWQVGDATAKVSYEGAIEPIMSILPDYSHSLSGHLVLDAALATSADIPTWGGQLSLHDANYAYEAGGISLENFELNAGLTGTGTNLEGTLLVEQERAADSDGGTHKLKGSGKAEFKAIDDWGVSLDLALRRNPLLQHRNYKGQASGKLSLRASPKSAELVGKIHFDQFEVLIPPPGPQPIERLKIVKTDQSGNPVQEDRIARQTSLLPELQINVEVEADRELVIRGRGIETEWKGAVQLAGQAASPVLSGLVESIRGQIDFGDRKFLIEKGRIIFSGGSVEEADLDLVARYNFIGGPVAKIIVLGKAQSPEIRFVSEPPLPEEEIVALVLFGKPLKELGPIEALRTGTAVAQMSGRMGSFDGAILDRTRRAIGIDYLSIDPQGANGQDSIVTAGKYIGRGAFLTITEGVNGQQAAIAIEYQLADDVIVRTQVDETSATEGSILWEKDY